MTTAQDNHDPDPSTLESMRRMAYDASKWLQTKTFEITKYEFNKEELNQFYDELRDVIGRVKNNYKCQLCNIFPKKSYVLSCGHLLCHKCSHKFTKKKLGQSTCPTCQEGELEDPIPFYAMNSVVSDINHFIKESKFFQEPSRLSDENSPKDVSKRLKSMNFVLLQRLKNIETQLMCDFCFNKLSKTYLVKCASNAFTYRPFCEGCGEKYIKFYEKEQGRKMCDPIRFALLDEVVNDFYEYLLSVVHYSSSSKLPVRFVSASNSFSLVPIYKMLAGAILVGVVLLYFSN